MCPTPSFLSMFLFSFRGLPRCPWSPSVPDYKHNPPFPNASIFFLVSWGVPGLPVSPGSLLWRPWPALQPTHWQPIHCAAQHHHPWSMQCSPASPDHPETDSSLLAVIYVSLSHFRDSILICQWPAQFNFSIISDFGWHCLSNATGHMWFQSTYVCTVMQMPWLNIATGETSQAITSFHLFDYFDFYNIYHYLTLITSWLPSLVNFHH